MKVALALEGLNTVKLFSELRFRQNLPGKAFGMNGLKVFSDIVF